MLAARSAAPTEHMAWWLYSRSFMSSFLVVAGCTSLCDAGNVQSWDLVSLVAFTLAVSFTMAAIIECSETNCISD